MEGNGGCSIGASTAFLAIIRKHLLVAVERYPLHFFLSGDKNPETEHQPAGNSYRRHCDAETLGTQVYKSVEGGPGSWCTVLQGRWWHPSGTW